MDFLIRNVPDDISAAIDTLAQQAGVSRETFLRQRVAAIAAEAWTPTRFGQGWKGFTPTGGHCTLKRMGDGEPPQVGAVNLSREEMAAFQRAKLIADSRNGGDWMQARRILEAAGFEVFAV